MGKHSWAGAESWQGANGQQPSAWSYWSGTWKANKQNGKWNKTQANGGGQGQPPKDQKFPSYHDMETHRDKDTPNGVALSDGELQLSGSGDDSFIKLLQKHLNSSRRLDARARKMAQDKEDMNRKWAEFRAKLRESFIEQRQKYIGD